MKPITESQKEAVLINNTIEETISKTDMDRIIAMIEKDPDYNTSDSLVYFTVKENRYPDWDVVRLYQMHTFHNKTGIKYLCVEVLRNFKKGRHNLIFAKLLTTYGYFSYDSQIELRANKRSWDGCCVGDKLREKAYEIEMQQGEDIACIRITPKELNKILCIPYGETLYNAGEKNLIGHLRWWNYKKEFLASIRIAKKHGFVFTDENSHEWFDMVYSIIKTSNDNHNPKYVAPKNLNEMHNYFLRKFQALQKKKEEQAEERAMIRREKDQLARIESERNVNDDYIKRRRRFFDLNISNSKFDIHVLRDVQEFFEEGKEMHHCVFSMGYYKRPDSLIMSCRDKLGNRIETIEVNLSTFKIEQCYGKYDQFTEHHKAILNLIKKNMNKIRMCYNGRYKAHKGNTELLHAV